jgi:hypothetical protein
MGSSGRNFNLRDEYVKNRDTKYYIIRTVIVAWKNEKMGR